MYFWIREDWTLDNTIIGTPELGDDEIDFLLGTPITRPFKTPIEFETTYKKGMVPHHYFDYGTCIPAVSKQFVDALRESGVDNFDVYPAILKSSEDKTVWTDYFALNIIGMVNATDLDNSEYEEIMGGNDEGMPPLGSFTVLALHEDKIKPFDVFREPVGNNLIMSERVLDKLATFYPNGGLGIIAHEVILT